MKKDSTLRQNTSRINVLEQDVFILNKKYQILSASQRLVGSEATSGSQASHYANHSLKSGLQTPMKSVQGGYQQYYPNHPGHSGYSMMGSQAQTRRPTRAPSRQEYAEGPQHFQHAIPPNLMQPRRVQPESSAAKNSRKQLQPQHHKPETISLIEDEKIGKRKIPHHEVENIDEEEPMKLIKR